MAASDYTKTLPASIQQWVPGEFVCLGTDGFGRSDARAALRAYFEVDARHIVHATLAAMLRTDKISRKKFDKALAKLRIDPEKPDPAAL